MWTTTFHKFREDLSIAIITDENGKALANLHIFNDEDMKNVLKMGSSDEMFKLLEMIEEWFVKTARWDKCDSLYYNIQKITRKINDGGQDL